MKKRRLGSAGFTLMEMLVVLGIIALIVSFALPKFNRSIDKTKVTNAVQALGSASAQAESICATTNSAPTAPNSLFGDTPTGYTAGSINGTACIGLILAFSPGPGSTLPKLCIQRGKDSTWKYGLGATADWLRQDIPVPDAKFDASIACP